MKKRNPRLITLFVLLLTIAMMFAGCGGGSDTPAETPEENTPVEEPAEEPVAQPAEEPAQDASQEENAADSHATLEDFVNSDDEVKASIDELNDSEEGMVVEIKGNVVVYTYTFTEYIEPDAAEDMREQFATSIEEVAPTFEGVAQGLEEESGIDGISVRVIYLNTDGTEIYSHDFE